MQQKIDSTHDDLNGQHQNDKAVETTDRTLTDRAYEELEELISTLQLPPGTVLSESSLATRLGIGRTPIREALQRLKLDGLVVVLPRRGVLVSEINLKTQLRLLEVRRELEGLMSALAAERATDKERQAFMRIEEDMRSAAERSDDIGFMRIDRELHLLISEAARNEFATRSMGLMHALSRRFWYFNYKRAADLPLTATFHADLARAIADGDKDAARAASNTLVDYIERFARKTLDL